MDQQRFDDLTRFCSTRSRRSVLSLLAGAVVAAVARVVPATAQDGDGDLQGDRRCQRLNQKCGKGKRCCNGLTCRGRHCRCKAGFRLCNGRCIGPNGCCEDDECSGIQFCRNGICACPPGTTKIAGGCAGACAVLSDCPGPCSCRNHVPAGSGSAADGVCVDEPFNLCNAPICNNDGNCGENEVCIQTGCSGSSLRCVSICLV